MQHEFLHQQDTTLLSTTVLCCRAGEAKELFRVMASSRIRTIIAEKNYKNWMAAGAPGRWRRTHPQAKNQQAEYPGALLASLFLSLSLTERERREGIGQYRTSIQYVNFSTGQRSSTICTGSY